MRQIPYLGLIKNHGWWLYIVTFYLFFVVKLAMPLGLNQSFRAADIGLIVLGGFFVSLTALALQWPFRKWRLGRSLVFSFFTLIYCGLGFYHYRVSDTFDLNILSDHFFHLWQRGTLGPTLVTVVGTFTMADYVRSIVFVVVAFLVSFKTPLPTSTNLRQVGIGILSLALSGFILLVECEITYDELSLSLRSIAGLRQTGMDRFQRYLPANQTSYPYIRKVDNPPVEDKPHIFLILVESFNSHFVETKDPVSSREFTPYFNQLLKRGVYFSNFYGQSVQTARAHFSILCGLPPKTGEKVFIRHADKNFHCVSSVLQELGYETIFSKANEDLQFDNTQTFLSKNGFALVNTMSRSDDHLHPDIFWGWGLEDDVFYHRELEYLRYNDSKKPLFVVMATISSHMRFDQIPKDKRDLYPEPRNTFEHYANAIHLTDHFLETFVNEFETSDFAKNSVLIITGDHSFPIGEHSNFHNQNFAYEENFKTPMLILDYRHQAKRLPPRREDRAYSQLNIAPTLLQFVGYTGPTHFVHQSLLSDPPEFIPLLQPYAGIYVPIIHYPLKYVYFDRQKREMLFDLSQDPQEKQDIISQMNDANLLHRFREEVAKVFNFNQVLRENRIWSKEFLSGVNKQLDPGKLSVKFEDK